MQRADGMVEVKCEACTDSGGKAEAFCRQCAAFVCIECIKLHKKIKVLSLHEIASFDQLKQGKVKEIILKDFPTKKCLVHEEPLIIYCFDCHTLICHCCTVTDHGDHNFEFSKVAAPNIKTKLSEKVEHLREVTDSLLHAVQTIHTRKVELGAHGDSVVNTIQTSFKELREVLDEREKELLTETKKAVHDNTDKLCIQEKNLSLASAEVRSVTNYVEQSVSHCSDYELLTLHPDMTCQIQQKMEVHSMSGRNLEELNVGVLVSVAKALQQLCQMQANVVTLVDLDKCRATVEMPKMSEVAETSTAEVTFIPVQDFAMPTLRNCKLESHLKCLSSDILTECIIIDDETEVGKYSVSYIPTVRGCHELIVSVNGQQVAGSPIPVFVSIPPSQVGWPIKIWDGIERPCGIAVNSVEEIIVTELEGDIVKFNAENEKQILVKFSQHKLKSLRGIAVDSDDNIYCISDNTNKVMKCNKDGSNIRMYEVKQEEHPGFYGVTIVGDEVMMCEVDNEGSIVVYDKELVFKRHIQCAYAGKLLDVAADGCGNVWSTDITNSCIHIFTDDGTFVRFVTSSDAVQLSVPWGLCVSGQYVYVANTGNHSISVFTVDGVDVISFGQYGTKEGCFQNPSYICVDKNGYVYVSDLFNNRVVCF